MTDSDFLHLFIEEPIYIIDGEGPDMAVSKDESSPIANPTPLKEETPEIASSVVEEPAAPVYVKPLPTLGENLKHCIVLVDSAEEILEEPLKALLYKIMGSVKRNPDDILLANCRNADSDQLEALLANNNHRHVLSFGCDLLPQLKGLDNYEIQREGPKSFIKGDSLVNIQDDVEKKKALWKALQEMF
ncbi:hypothetical protein [Roseivirga misakiensis]|uniref:DNA polymerase III subunit psi n=1 Tax=Roseivirga misakiensis TaxID=1563681 RepID=A0A1E5T0D7_9BACT|nr:hypothetical protein [Roseivirga misakiensis]OEK04840.1 hypothetical protein BFP71_15480 [Roseivirga misakiensis]